MVSIFQLSQRKPLWSHITTGVPTLDSMLDLHTDGILDFQTIPTNSAYSAVLCSIIASHLAKSLLRVVVAIEGLNTFPWEMLQLHPLYDPVWNTNGQIMVLSAPTFALLYAFFAYMPLPKKPLGTYLVVATTFHELVELYRLDVTNTYEELLLKHRIDQNKVLLDNVERIKEQGLSGVVLPKLPPNLPLVRDNPHVKAQVHVNQLLSHMSDFVFENSALVLILGMLEPKFRPYSAGRSANTSMHASSPPPSDAPGENTSFRDSTHLVFTPVTLSNNADNKLSVADSKVTLRLVFYNDWYWRTPHFEAELRQPTDDDYYFVSSVKVHSMSGVKNITEPVYFDFKGSMAQKDWFVDLLVSGKQQSLSDLVQASLLSTQINSDSVFPELERNIKRLRHEPPLGTLTQVTNPESRLTPVPVSSQDDSSGGDNTKSQDSEGQHLSQESSQGLFIEESDVERIGTPIAELSDEELSSTPLEDNSDEEPDWMARR